MLRLRRIRHPQHGSGGTARWSALLVPRDRRRGLTVPPTVMALRAQQSWQGSEFTRPLSRFRRLCDLLTYVLSACHVSAPCTGTDSPTGRGGCSRRPQRTTRKSSAGRRTVHKRDSNFRPPTYTDVFHVKHRPNSPGTAHSTGGGETRRDRSPNPPQSPLTRPAENPRWAIGGLRLMKTPTDGTPANRAPTDPGTVRTADQGSGSPPPPSRQSRAVGGGIAHASRPVDAPRSPGSARPTHTTPHRAAPRRTAPHRPRETRPDASASEQSTSRTVDVGHLHGTHRRRHFRQVEPPSRGPQATASRDRACGPVCRMSLRSASLPPGLPPVGRSKSHDFTGHHPRTEALGYRRSTDLCRPTSSPFQRQRQRCRWTAAREAAPAAVAGVTPARRALTARPCAVPVCRARVPSAPTRADVLRRRLGTPGGAGGSLGGWALRSTARSASTPLRVARDPPVASEEGTTEQAPAKKMPDLDRHRRRSQSRPAPFRHVMIRTPSGRNTRQRRRNVRFCDSGSHRSRCMYSRAGKGSGDRDESGFT